MSFPGASSGRSKVTPFRSDSHSPDPNASGLPGSRDGMYRDGKGSKSSYRQRSIDRPPMRQVYADQLTWAARHLPGEFGPFVALGVARLKRQGTEPTAERVLAYLRDLRRDAASREATNG